MNNTYLVLFYNVPFLWLSWTPLPTLIWDVINGCSLKHIFTRSDVFIIFQEFQLKQAYGMWIFQEFLTFFKFPNFFPQFCQNIFQNCLRSIKVRSPSVSWFSPRLYLIWREFHASSPSHLFRGNLGNQTMKKCSLCRNRQLTRFIWEEEIKFFIGLYFFFLMTPWWKGRRVMACSYQ